MAAGFEVEPVNLNPAGKRSITTRPVTSPNKEQSSLTTTDPPEYTTSLSRDLETVTKIEVCAGPGNAERSRNVKHTGRIG